MKYLARAAGIAGVGALAGTSVLAAATPAGAATTEAHKSASLTFVTFGGAAVTCTLSDDAFHYDPNSVQANFTTNQTGLCEAQFDGKITARDQGGRTHVILGGAVGFVLILQANEAYTPISTHVDASFTNCDPSRSAACGLSVTANPK